MKAEQDFTTGSIPKKMLKFVFPILGALVLQAMYGAVDLLIVGRFGSDFGISGVSTGSNIMNTVTFVTNSIATGVTVLMGIYIGSGRAEKIGKLLGNAICFFAALGAVVSVLLAVFARPFAILMQTPKEALDDTVTYIRICGIGFIFVMFYNFISSVFRGLGDSKLPVLFVGIACVANILGDLLFVAVFKLDVAGAAIATVLAQAISVALSLAIIKRKKLPFKIKREDLHFGGEIIKFVKIGAPLALQEILTNGTFLAICAFINVLGIEASSGYGIAQKLVSFIMLIPSSIMQSMASFVSQNVGAGEHGRAKRAMKWGMAVGCTIGVFVGLLTFFKGDMLADIFTNDSAYIECAAQYLKGFAPEAAITCILFSFMGYFNGYGKSLFVMIQGIIQSLLIRLPFSYVMSIQENASLTKIGLAPPTATVVGIAMCLGYYICMQKKMKSSNKTLPHNPN